MKTIQVEALAGIQLNAILAISKQPLMFTRLQYSKQKPQLMMHFHVFILVNRRNNH